ncbi:MAG TPA: glycosyltransferase family A protein [Longimicrobiaceae bacterium]|jgi:glycosyltransferase involved in cell wall biosynthesis|nr:glycosyltransferase family A protein [Longimicrobiaceae bacterium]
MLESAPRVSVVVPCYNAADFIGRALDSILAQSYRAFEVLVINDGSPDTPALEEALRPYLSRIRYVRQENQGPGGARNTGILQARGEYVAFLDSDDAWEREFLAEQMRLLEADPELDLVYADALLVGDTPFAGRTFMDICPSQGEVTFESLLREECSVVTSCVVAKRQSLIAAGLFDARFFHSEDFDLWLRLLQSGGRIRYHRRCLGLHQAHRGSLTAEGTKLLEGKIAVCTKLRDSLDLSRSQRGAIEAYLSYCCGHLALETAKNCLSSRRYREATRNLREARGSLPGWKLRLLTWTSVVAPSLLRRLHVSRRSERQRSVGEAS